MHHVSPGCGYCPVLSVLFVLSVLVVFPGRSVRRGGPLGIGASGGGRHDEECTRMMIELLCVFSANGGEW